MLQIVNIEKDISTLQNYEYMRLLDKYFELLVDEKVCFLENLQDFVIYIDEPTRCIEKSRSILYENNESIKMLTDKEYLYPEYVNTLLEYTDIEKILKTLSNVYLERINIDNVLHENRKKISFETRELNFYKNSMEILFQDIKAKKDNIVLLVFPSLVRVEQIKNMLIDEKINVIKIDKLAVFIEIKIGDQSIMIPHKNKIDYSYE